MTMRARNLIMIAAASLAVAGAVDAVTAGVARAVETVWSCGLTNARGVNRIFTPSHVYGINTSDHCYGGHGLWIDAPGNTVRQGQSASWQANAPAGLQIVLFYVHAGEFVVQGVNDRFGYGGGFYWNGGGKAYSVSNDGADFGRSSFASSSLRFEVTCRANPCNNKSANAHVEVHDIGLQVAETRAPTLSNGAGLWQSSGWVRDDWPLSFNGDSPSGICALTARVAGQGVGYQAFTPDDTVWHQCAATGLRTTVHTAQFGDGTSALVLHGDDAAGLGTPDGAYTKTLYIDNQAPSVAVTGAGEAPSTSGTQYLTATGTAGPSGVSGMSCDVDGQPESYAGASAQVPVAGIGVHTVTCVAANNSRDASGAVAVSAPASHTISVRQPTASAVSFSRIANALRCHLQRVRVKVPGGVVTIHRDHKLVHVHRRGHMKVVTEKRCHAPVVYRRVPVFVTIHGHRVKRYKRVREVLTPRQVTSTTKRVAYGHSTTVNGVLLANDGSPLAGQSVQVLSAPDDGHSLPALVATTTTGANGDWTARLPAGPSRVVEAYYPGATLDEPAMSRQVRIIVPARVRLLSISPRQVPWGGTVHITGQLDGGYIPAKGENVRLRMGFGRSIGTYGVRQHIPQSGRFETTYTFGAGDPSVHRTYSFEIATLLQGNYPFAPANSGRLTVIVGGHPRGGGGGGGGGHPAHHHKKHTRVHHKRDTRRHKRTAKHRRR